MKAHENEAEDTGAKSSARHERRARSKSERLPDAGESPRSGRRGARTGARAAEPQFFRDAAALRVWFAKNAAVADELIVAYKKKETGVPSVTWPESVDEALCVGWIDSIRRKLDADSYTVRFTPRRAGSSWSTVNVARVQVLQAEGRMQPAGLAAFAKRGEEAQDAESCAQRDNLELTADELRRFRGQRAAWAYYEKLPPSYRRAVTRWVIGAKKTETRTGRLGKWIQACAEQRRLTG